MAQFTAARRYAKALFALGREQQALEPVCRDLANLHALMATSPEWRAFVLEPVGTMIQRAEAIAAMTQGKLHPLTSQFLSFLDAKRRFALLPDIYLTFQDMCDEANGVIRATAYAAAPLTEAQTSELAKRLSARFGKHVLVSTAVHADLIGGIRVLIRDQVFDFSVATQLEQLKKRLIYA